MTALNIRDAETHELARQLAEITGKTMTQAVRDALKEQVQRVAAEREAEVERKVERILEFGRRWRASPIVDPRPVDEILAYDENGLPV